MTILFGTRPDRYVWDGYGVIAGTYFGLGYGYGNERG